jgi:hypothetical protein
MPPFTAILLLGTWENARMVLKAKEPFAEFIRIATQIL